MSSTVTRLRPRRLPAGLTREEAVARAREMRAGGWTLEQIRDYLARHGYPVHKSTVMRWTDPQAAARHRRIARESARRIYRERNPEAPRRVWDEQARRERIRQLHQAGVTRTMIAKVCTLDFGEYLTEWDVRKALRATGRPETDNAA